jgi:hypothetical protein
MKKQFILFIVFTSFCFSSLYAQNTKKTPTGLGIDLGIGYNMMTLDGKTNLGVDTTSHYNQFWMQPCLRIHYDINVKNFGQANSLKVKTFIGYYTFGGKLKRSDIDEFDIVAFSSIEAGAGITLDFIKMFQVSPLFKAQYVFSANERYIREKSKPAKDVINTTNVFCYNAGLQFRFKYKHFTVGIEGWYGLSDIHKDANKTAKENNFRLLVGYEF